MTAAVDRLTRDYRAAFLRYLPRREEVVLAAGYEIGRGSLSSGVSLLDLASVHHEILLEVLADSSPEELGAVTTAAREFFVEVLAAYDMTQRALLDEG